MCLVWRGWQQHSRTSHNPRASELKPVAYCAFSAGKLEKRFEWFPDFAYWLAVPVTAIGIEEKSVEAESFRQADMSCHDGWISVVPNSGGGVAKAVYFRLIMAFKKRGRILNHFRLANDAATELERAALPFWAVLCVWEKIRENRDIKFSV